MEPSSLTSLDHSESDLLIIDTETTGSGEDPGNEPIKVSWKFLAEKDSDESFLMCPGVPCLPSCTVIHGITQRQMQTYTPIEKVLPLVWDRFHSYSPRTVVCGYHVSYDIWVLNNAFRKYLQRSFRSKRVLDVMRLAQKLLKIKELGNFRLDTVYYFLYPRFLERLHTLRATHSASVDVQLTETVLAALWARLEDSLGETYLLDQVVDYSLAPMVIDIWPFGKHKGVAVKDVLSQTPDYVEWFMDKCDFRDQWPDLVYTIKQLQAF